MHQQYAKTLITCTDMKSNEYLCRICNYSYSWNLQIHFRGKKSLVLVPGTSWISNRTSIYFHPMSCGQVKYSLIVYFSLTRTSYLITGQVKILMYLPGGQVKICRFFYPCILLSVGWEFYENENIVRSLWKWRQLCFMKVVISVEISIYVACSTKM